MKMQKKTFPAKWDALTGHTWYLWPFFYLFIYLFIYETPLSTKGGWDTLGHGIRLLELLARE